MQYTRPNPNHLIARFDKGEEILTTLNALAEQEEIACATVQGIGLVDKLEVSVFDSALKSYHSITGEGIMEVTSLSGSITRKQGAPYLHLHIMAADPKNNSYIGGHLNFGRVSTTLEVFLHIIPAEINRQFSEEIGLNLLKF